MAYYILKTIISAIILVFVSELAKTYSWFAALVISLPIISILAISWLYIDTQDIQKIIDLSTGIFWLVIPSLVFFIVLPLLLKVQVPFWWSLILSCFITAITYLVYTLILNKWGVM